jgi:hypothetical protein
LLFIGVDAGAVLCTVMGHSGADDITVYIPSFMLGVRSHLS